MLTAEMRTILSNMYFDNFQKKSNGLFESDLYQIDFENPPRQVHGEFKIFLKKKEFEFSEDDINSKDWFRAMNSDEYKPLIVNNFGYLQNSIGGDNSSTKFCGISPSSAYVKQYLKVGVIIRVSGTNNLYRVFDYQSVGQALLRCAGYKLTDINLGTPFSIESGGRSLGLGSQSKTLFVPRNGEKENDEGDYVRKNIDPKKFGDILSYFKRHAYVKQDVCYISMTQGYCPDKHDNFINLKEDSAA